MFSLFEARVVQTGKQHLLQEYLQGPQQTWYASCVLESRCAQASAGQPAT